MNWDVKNRIINGSLDMFHEKGIKNVTMDMIASELSISKRTIYEYFDNKEKLVLACLELFGNRMKEECEKKKEHSANSLEFLLNVLYINVQMFRIVNVNFFKDIKKMFPNIQSDVKKKELENIEIFGKILQTAQDEGFIRIDYNIEILKKIFNMMVMALKDPTYYDFTRYPFPDVFWTNSELFFRGIATEKGMKLIDNFNKKKIVT